MLALYSVLAAYAPAQVFHHLAPKITFTLDADEPAPPARYALDANLILNHQQLKCTADINNDGVPDILNSTETLLERANEGEPIAMAALGHLFLLGQDCARKRNFTWALHWLDGAVARKQPDAMALMGFLHASRALPRIYNTSVGRDFTPEAADALFVEAAELGSPYASLALGARYADGIGVGESCPTAASYYEAAAAAAVDALRGVRRKAVEQGVPVESDHRVLLSREMGARDKIDAASIEYMDFVAYAGDPAGQVGMGHLYYAGTNGVATNVDAAVRLYEAAAARGEPSGHANRGLHLLRRGDARCIAPLRRAAKRNDPSGWAGLGYAYLYGVGVPQSDELAARALWIAASKGHLDAIYNLGVLTLRGLDGAEGSVATAYRYFSVAADFSHPLAQLVVGRMALHGLGVRRDCRTALFYLRHAAEHGPMLTSLGSVGLVAYEAQRPQRALMHYMLAAHAGVEAAQHNAGFLYAHVMPRVRPADAAPFRAVGIAYLRLAVLQGSVEGQVQLATLLEESSQDYARSNELFRSAARSGSTDAMWHLGYNYLKGRGVPADARRAWVLLRDSGLHSKHAQLRGLERLGFGLARLLYEGRVLITLAAAAALAFSTGGNPASLLGGALQRPRSGAAGTEEWTDDEAADDFEDLDE